MGKQWEISRSELQHDSILNKLYNAEKFHDLAQQLREVEDKFDAEEVKTATRMVMEEVTNIICYNKTWHDTPLKVRTDFKSESPMLKLEIIYSGSEYFDPEKQGLTTVIGSRNDIESYERTFSYENGFTHIKIRMKLRKA